MGDKSLSFELSPIQKGGYGAPLNYINDIQRVDFVNINTFEMFTTRIEYYRVPLICIHLNFFKLLWDIFNNYV